MVVALTAAKPQVSMAAHVAVSPWFCVWDSMPSVCLRGVQNEQVQMWRHRLLAALRYRSRPPCFQPGQRRGRLALRRRRRRLVLPGGLGGRGRQDCGGRSLVVVRERWLHAMIADFNTETACMSVAASRALRKGFKCIRCWHAATNL